MASEVFSVQLAEFANRFEEKAETVIRKAAIDILGRIVDRTPVGNPDLWKANIERKAKGLPPYPPGYVGGRLRGNWNVGIGGINTALRPIDKGGEETKRRGERVIGLAKPEQDIYITNSLPYAIPVEYGWSSQAPAGMVRVTVAEWSGLIEKAAKEANK